MRLKRLEIVGFKSFFEKTTVTFQAGITGIVGPNGCGKSNLADAILWVLGEQSAKNLRGEKMEDVIFNGTEQRKPLGMAEVTLTFTEIAGELEGTLSAYRELSMTRRLFRSGESEYLINKTPCRLKDIRELLIDAGVGYHAHTVIEQGKVDSILNASPMQRRELIEETAGIAKYRLRKAEALRKLEATEQNLARVRDIIGEVRRQMNSLDRQARKAERYRKLAQEIQDLDLKIAAADWKTLQTEESRLSGLEQEQEDALQAARSALALVEGKNEQVKLNLTGKAAQIDALRQGLFEKDSEIQRLEARIELLRSQTSSWQEEISRIATELEQFAEVREKFKAEENRIQEEQTELEEALKGHLGILGEISERSDRLNEEIRGRSQEIERRRHELFEIASRLTEQKNTLYHLKLRQEALQRRRQQGIKETAEIHQAGEEVRARLLEAERLGEGEEEALQTTKQEREKLSRNVEGTQEHLRQLDVKLARLREAWVGKKGELASLRSFYQGLWTAQEAAGSGAPLPNQSVDGTHGMVADLIDVPAQFERAIEAVLENRLRGIIVEGPETVRLAVAQLKESTTGRGVLVPRLPRCREGMALPEGQREGVFGTASHLVTPRAGYERVADHLLGRALIVRDLDTAFHLWEHCPIPGLMVTLEGEVIDSGGMVSGGRGEGLLQQKRAIQTLGDEIQGLGSELEALEEQRTRVQGAHHELGLQMDRLSDALNQGEISRGTRRHQIDLLRAEIDRISERLVVMQNEAEMEKGEADTLSTQIEQTAASSESLAHDRIEHERALQDLQHHLDGSRQRLSAVSEEVTRYRVVVASQKERREHLMQTVERLRREQIETVQKEEDRRRNRVGLLERLATAQADGEKSKNRILSLTAERNELAAIYRNELEAQAELQKTLQEHEDHCREQRQGIERLQEAKNRVHLSRTELLLKQKSLEEMILQQYQVDLKVAGQSSNRGSDEEISIEEARARVDPLKQQVSEMGPVNIGAIDEYQELSERHRFLSEQESDLTRSIADLREAIDKINKTTQSLFTETFNALNSRFAEVFVSFFAGGTAQLVLLEEGKPLESGVEILVQPPGKRLRSISLLSGGEKALTAISLLFASFLIHPGPFCLLDELDAPLDEENTRRFADAVKGMAERIQFIIVTHNKRTMEAADMLHGVTMEESGLSKIVSVRLGDPLVTRSHPLEEALQERP